MGAQTEGTPVAGTLCCRTRVAGQQVLMRCTLVTGVQIPSQRPPRVSRSVCTSDASQCRVSAATQMGRSAGARAGGPGKLVSQASSPWHANSSSAMGLLCTYTIDGANSTFSAAWEMDSMHAGTSGRCRASHGKQQDDALNSTLEPKHKQSSMLQAEQGSYMLCCTQASGNSDPSSAKHGATDNPGPFASRAVLGNEAAAAELC